VVVLLLLHFCVGRIPWVVPDPGRGLGSGGKAGFGARRLNPEKVMSRAVSSAPWGLARWCLAVVPTPLGGGWWGRPNHRQLSREVLGTRDPTTARDIRCLHGAVGLGPGWRRAGLESAQGRKHAANCNGGCGEGCRVSGGPERLRLRMAIL
jgi:hypothetical protein